MRSCVCAYTDGSIQSGWQEDGSERDGCKTFAWIHGSARPHNRMPCVSIHKQANRTIMPTSKQHQAIYPSHLDIWMCMCLLDKTVIVTDISLQVRTYTSTRLLKYTPNRHRHERERETHTHTHLSRILHIYLAPTMPAPVDATKAPADEMLPLSSTNFRRKIPGAKNVILHGSKSIDIDTDGWSCVCGQALIHGCVPVGTHLCMHACMLARMHARINK